MIKIRLENHISIKSTGAVSKICKPLFDKTRATYFCYLRRYRNNSFTFLPTVIDVGRYFFEDGIYPSTWIAGLKFDDLKSGYFLWDIAKQISRSETQTISSILSKDLKLVSGVDIVEKHQDYCDFYSFSSNTPDIYFVPLQYFYEFVYYFKQESRSLLIKSYEDRLKLPPQELFLPPIPIGNMEGIKNHEKDEEFNIRRYYLSNDVFLTRREVEILRKLDKGEPVKCVADHMCISPRTLEQHIANIKDKLNLSRTQEILHFAKHHHILT